MGTKERMGLILNRLIQPVETQINNLFLILGCISLAGMLSHWSPDSNAVFTFFKLAASTIVIGILPGALLVLAIRPLARMTLLKMVGIGIAVSFGLVQVLTFLSIIFHISSLVISLAICGLCLTATIVLWKKTDPKNLVFISVGEISISLLILIVSFLLYLRGAPFEMIEDQIHISVIRRLAFLPRPAIDNLYFTPGFIYTYPFPGIHMYFALISRLSDIDPMFVYHKMRFFWGPAAITFLYLTAQLIFQKNPRLPFVIALTGILFVVNGSFADVPNFYWGQLVPTSHNADIAMGVLLPGLLMLTFYFIASEEKKGNIFFFAATLTLGMMIIIVHSREIVQYLIYLGSFFLAMLIFRRDKKLMIKVLLIAIIMIITTGIYVNWHGKHVSSVANITADYRDQVVDLFRKLRFKDFFFLPLNALEIRETGTQPYFLSYFSTLHYGWNLLVLLISPLMLWKFRKNIFVLCIGMSLFVYMLIIRFPALSLPYIYFTYFEILFTPVRNMIFFIQLMAGGIFYLLAVYLSSINSKAAAWMGAGGLIVFLGFAWDWLQEHYRLHRIDDIIFGSNALLVLILFYIGIFIVIPKTVPKRSDEKWEAAAQSPQFNLFLGVVLLALFAWTWVPGSSLLSPGLFSNSFQTPAQFVDQLACNQEICFPNTQFVEWTKAHLSPDSVLGINIHNEVLPSTLILSNSDVWPAPYVYSTLTKVNFQDYNYFYQKSMDIHGDQPFFNDQETIIERMKFVHDLGITHILIDPILDVDMREVLAKWPDVFTRQYDDGKWAIYRVIQ